jgi:hypothetical protein
MLAGANEDLPMRKLSLWHGLVKTFDTLSFAPTHLHASKKSGMIDAIPFCNRAASI